jgi:hypothetical protein
MKRLLHAVAAPPGVSGTKSGRVIGRPAVADGTKDEDCALLQAGRSERFIARQVGIGKGTVGRVRARVMASACHRQLRQ